jgi:pSer/pThr/pTyr-binding forkhead associated (FHA) protein
MRILMRDGSVTEREIAAEETKIGKGPLNDLILADPAVSTAHAVIRREGGHYTLTDLGSRNGTLLNDERLTEPRPLKHGDVIKMGRCTLTFRLVHGGQTAILDRPVAAYAPTVAPPDLSEGAVIAAIVAAGLATEADLARLRAAAGEKRLLHSLLEDQHVNDLALRDLISSRFGIPLVDLEVMKIDAEVARTLGASTLRQNLIFPALGASEHLALVMADPTDSAIIERVRRATRKPVEIRLAASSEITAQLDRHFAPRLVGVLPTGEKLERLINKVELEIGKAPHNDLVLTHPTVSSTHAIVLARNGGYSIVDLGSSNGTFVNGSQLGDQAHTLQHGDKIQIADVVLTYRNPSETVENKTARLSPETLDALRRRAGLPSTSGPSAAALPVEKKEEKKEEKKKKKDDDRLKAALVNSISRVAAQAIGAALTVGLTIYLLSGGIGQRAGRQDTQPSSEQSRLSAPGSFVPLRGGTFETSGVAQVPDTETVVMVDDGKPNRLLMMQLSAAGQQAGEVTQIPLNVELIDPEAITYGGNFFYIIGSQSDPAQGPRNALVRFTLNPATRAVSGAPEVIPDLRRVILEALPELRADAEKPGAQGGLNIEGIAWDPSQERLLLGLRSPVIGGRAVIIPLNPRLGPLAAGSLQVSQPRTIQLDLGGHGIRDITYSPVLKSFLIISGAPEDAKRTDFVLWEWNGDADQSKPEAHPRKESTFDRRAKPEGITAVTIGGRNFVLIVDDSSRYLKLDYAGAQ